MADVFQKIGENVRKRRKALGISQEALASMIDRDTRSVVAIETGNRNPTIETLQKLCKALKARSSDILPF